MFTNTLRRLLGRNIERSIHGAKPSGMRKQKPQPVEDSGADTTVEGDNTEPEEVMMVQVT
jgi:hypothetical protein